MHFLPPAVPMAATVAHLPHWYFESAGYWQSQSVDIPTSSAISTLDSTSTILKRATQSEATPQSVARPFAPPLPVGENPTCSAPALYGCEGL